MNRAEDISEGGIAIRAAAVFSGKRKVSRVFFEREFSMPQCLQTAFAADQIEK